MVGWPLFVPSHGPCLVVTVRTAIVMIGRSEPRPLTSSGLLEPPKKPEYEGGTFSSNIGGHLVVIWAGGATMVALEGAPGAQWWVVEMGEICPNFSWYVHKRSKIWTNYPLPPVKTPSKERILVGGLWGQRDARALGSRALTTRVGRFRAPKGQIGHFGPNRDRPPPWTSPMYPCHRSMALGRMVGGSNALY